jgi:hypothetical protein
LPIEPLKIADKDARIGEKVWTTGYPVIIKDKKLVGKGLTSTFRSIIGKSAADIFTIIPFGMILEGMSGSPLLNSRGEAIGLNKAEEINSNDLSIKPIFIIMFIYVLKIS